MADKISILQANEEQEEAYDTSEPVQVNKARKKSARKKADRLRFIEAAMQHEEGRAWFYDLLNFCRIFETPYISGDPYHTAFRCGNANIGLKILSDIQEAAPTDYLVMITENK